MLLGNRILKSHRRTRTAVCLVHTNKCSTASAVRGVNRRCNAAFMPRMFSVLSDKPIDGNLACCLAICKIALAQGRYRWRHDLVLRKLAEVLEVRRMEAAKDPPSKTRTLICFIGQGAGAPNISQRERSPLLTPGCDWNLRVDLDQQLKFPPEITTTSLRPDVVLWSPAVKTVILPELTIPWEGGMEAAFERKRDKYTEPVAECREAGWSTTIYPVEVGCRGFIGTSIQHLLRKIGVTGTKLKRASRELAEEAERASFWLWLRRKDMSWGKEGSWGGCRGRQGDVPVVAPPP
ncbi:uncharacterized protein LOC132894068 [Neoarius graeffei]|uniref:uncharacterized protein LOC132894068 n=1 Tax=Neoarius graeffei TaxID=443677 RepID=UPI00298C2C52|nr:uncharacterized protein LOC132894068 [Neoarius graeffei]